MLTNISSGQLWLAITFAVCFCLTLAAVIIYCVCWRPKSKTLQHVYVVDENGLKKVKNRSGSFYRFPSVTSFDVFKSARKPAVESTGIFFNCGLHESTDLSDKFDKSVLQFDVSKDPKGREEREEMMSCDSSDSRSTFYSVYPMLRSSSIADTYKSTFSDSDSVV